jgi:SAM-dependent methyltransferase
VEDGFVEWVAEFYRKQYEWADWRTRWADFDPSRSDPHVAAVARLAGEGPRRILELGAGTGTTAAALAHAGHDVVAIELQAMLAEYIGELANGSTGSGSLVAIGGDFYEVDPGGPFDVVAYFDGFGIGTDDDQRRLLDRVVGWLVPHGCALIDILTPWYWSKAAGNEEEFPEASGIRYRDRFDVEGSRMVEDMWRDGREDDVVTQSLRCYAPADLRLLLEGSGLELSAVEPHRDQWYGETCALDDAMLYLARLTRR